MKKKTLKQEAHEHYQRMIMWAKEQPQKGVPDKLLMHVDICEDWYADDCPYCSKYLSTAIDDCGKCPLNLEIEERGCESCCGNIWKESWNIESWEKWIKWAKKIDKFIQKNG
jgi:hypothetical protein